MKTSLVIGSRGSTLALTQTRMVAAKLQEAHPELNLRIEIISTKGDRVVDRSFAAIGGKGLFTKELENALLSGAIDLAIHSLKDLPTDLPEGLVLGAVPEREDPRDALICREEGGLRSLPEGAVVGTASLRRKAQLLAVRPDLHIVDLRGNIDTRLRRVSDGDFDAAVLASAGLHRIGRGDAITEYLGPDIMVPAPAQGVLGLEIRADDGETRALLVPIADAAALAESTAERAMLGDLGGGCHVPVGALARYHEGTLTLSGCVCGVDGEHLLKSELSCALPPDEVEEVARALGFEAAAALRTQGAAEIIAAIDGPAPAESGPLTGKTVVVTRAEGQGDAMAERLRREGADVLIFPAIHVMPPENPAEFDAPSTFDWLVFTSTNAVDMFFERAKELKYDKSELEECQICAVGPATAEAIRANGAEVALMPDKHVGEELVAALAQLCPDMTGKRFLFPRSDIARDYVPNALRDLGAEVAEAVVYRTAAPDVPKGDIDGLLAAAPDVVTFTSPSTVRNFCAILGSERVRKLTESAVLAVIGPVTLAAAGELGLDVEIRAGAYNAAGLVQAIVAHFSESAGGE